MIARLPLVLTPDEFGFLVRLHPRVVSRQCREGKIKGRGPKWRIPARELERWGVNLTDAATQLAERASPPPAPPPSSAPPTPA